MLFQSTLPRRERPDPDPPIVSEAPISIHAPAKGATACGSSTQDAGKDFNPRSREGSDL